MNNTWNIGIARVDITPQTPTALAGWSGHRISEGVRHPLWVKALALQDAHGMTAVLVTTDLLGLSRMMSEELAQRALRKFGLQRQQLIINSSHNHAGPVTGDLLHLYYELNAAELGTVAEYTVWLLDQIESAIGNALASLEPGTLSFVQNLCGFGVNRRRAPLGKTLDLPQVVDHDVPVLVIHNTKQEIRAVVFGYACHPTSFSTPQLCGDWPGFAQIELESTFPDTTAFFVAGCGGDINPLPRFGRYHETLTEIYGKILAASVSNALETSMRPIESILHLQFEETTLHLEEPPSRAELLAMEDVAINQGGDKTHQRGIEHQLNTLEQGSLATTVPYPIHVWKLGMLNLIALSGEPVVDYSLFLKTQYGFQNTWVAGYCNELTSYIPSLRVLREGGYEGKDGMLEYGWASTFTEEIEKTITASVAKLIQQAKQEQI